MGEKDDDLTTGGYVYGVPYREMRLRMLLTGTNAPTDEQWAEGLGRVLEHLTEYPLDQTIKVRAELSPETFEAVKALAALRGVDANTIVRQAIHTEKLIADNMKPGDELLIKKADGTFQKVLFGK
jgi:hypothetical protein